MMKVCTACGVEKSDSDFYRDGARLYRVCKSCKNAANARWQKENPEKRRAAALKSYYKHRDRQLARMADWRRNNRGKAKACDLAWRRNNPEQSRAKAATWRRDNPDAMRQQWERRRALRRRATIETVTAEQWDRLVRLFRHRCAYCGQRPKKLTRDHVVPLARGGTHSISNLVPACMHCNLRKYVNAPPPYQPVLEGVLGRAAPSKP